MIWIGWLKTWGAPAMMGAAPQVALTTSSTMRITPSVATTWTKWLDTYRRRISAISSASASSTVPTIAPATASTKNPV
ncbi:hypothetical protein D3C87_1418380 [compost metagenome]